MWILGFGENIKHCILYQHPLEVRFLALLKKFYKMS